ncbi:MAG: ABC transporter substrate-binding protein [Acidobacteriota bacterium]|jgi:NitT/TauT family transport system substrate-binding protein|nr:ABC transporter substrate-binding protein [Acidobacteriota bacterium]
MKTRRLIAGLVIVAVTSAVFCLNAADSLKKITVAYVATTCEAPIHIAKIKGFFKEEGLEADIVLGDWAFIKEGLALGRIDATQGLVMNYLKPIAEGLDAKFTAGVHHGCLHVMAPKNSPIKTARDLKGKRIGVPSLGSSPWVFAVRVVGDAGLNYQRDVEWKPYPTNELQLALEKGQVDAIALADPVAEILLREGKVRNVVNMSTDKPYSDEYCCVIVVNGKLAKQDPKTAAAITRAILKASKWVSAHPQEAAEVLVKSKAISGDVALNASVLKGLDYVPSVSGGKAASQTAGTSLKKVGILDKNVNVDTLTNRSFQSLPGVSDQWIKSVNVN